MSKTQLSPQHSESAPDANQPDRQILFVHSDENGENDYTNTWVNVSEVDDSSLVGKFVVVKNGDDDIPPHHKRHWTPRKMWVQHVLDKSSTLATYRVPRNCPTRQWLESENTLVGQWVEWQRGTEQRAYRWWVQDIGKPDIGDWRQWDGCTDWVNDRLVEKRNSKAEHEQLPCPKSSRIWPNVDVIE